MGAKKSNVATCFGSCQCIKASCHLAATCKNFLRCCHLERGSAPKDQARQPVVLSQFASVIPRGMRALADLSARREAGAIKLLEQMRS